MRKVKIEVKSNKFEEEPIEVIYMGSLVETGDHTHISYAESVLTGMEGVFTDIFIKSDRLEIVRSGNIESRMIFREKHKDTFVYRMDVGAMSIGLETDKLHVGKEENEIDIYIRYRLEIAGDAPDRNEMYIKITNS